MTIDRRRFVQIASAGAAEAGRLCHWVIEAAAAVAVMACRSIGRMVPKAKGVTLISKTGECLPFPPKGFDHFRKSGE